ncbi:hypothetical protein Tco_1269878 [Tanacetum coccineum]
MILKLLSTSIAMMKMMNLHLNPNLKIQNQSKKIQHPNHINRRLHILNALEKKKLKAQYGKFLDMIRAVRINVPLVDVLAGMPNYGKFLKELVSNKHKLEQISAAFLSDESSALIQNKVPPKLGDPKSFFIPCNFDKAFSCDALADLEDSKVPLILGRPFLHTADAAIRVKQKQLNLGVADENSESEFDTEEPPFEKITFNTDYKIKTSLEEPPTDLELKPLPDNLEYVFLEEPSFLPVIISSQLFEENKNKLVFVLKNRKQAFI